MLDLVKEKPSQEGWERWRRLSGDLSGIHVRVRFRQPLLCLWKVLSREVASMCRVGLNLGKGISSEDWAGTLG